MCNIYKNKSMHIYQVTVQMVEQDITMAVHLHVDVDGNIQEQHMFLLKKGAAVNQVMTVILLDLMGLNHVTMLFQRKILKYMYNHKIYNIVILLKSMKY